jgi:hypothetical protein
MTSKPIQSRSGRYRPTIPNGASRSRDPIPTKARPHPGSSETPTRSCSLATIQVGRYCLIDMHIPLGGGPPPHRHDFEESFTLLKGEIEATFRGEKSLVHALARPSTFRPTRRTPSPTLPSKRCGCCASACRPGRKSSSRKWVPRWRPAHQHRQAKKGRPGRVHEEGQRAYSQISHGALKPVRLGTTRLNDWDRLCRTEFLKLSDTHPGIIKGCRVPGTARLNDRNRSPRLGFKAGRIEKTGRIQLPGNSPPQTPVKQRRLISLTEETKRMS